jgi:flagellar hook-associated protein 2
MRLGDLGVTFQRDGLLGFDQAKFENALATDYKSVSEALTGTYDKKNGKTDGFIDLLDATARDLLAPPSGVLVTRKNGLDSQISQIDRQISNRHRVIAQKEEILKAKFARLEETMSKIRAQGSGLAGLGAAISPIQQLG